MSETFDLEPAARHLSDVVKSVDDSHREAPTPCDRTTVADLLDHLSGLARAFAAAARKELGPLTSTPPAPDGRRLDQDWRTTIPDHLVALARAWAHPSAWDGMTQVGGVDLPSAVAGRIALNEIVLHGWDLACATGQPYQPDEASLRACLASLEALYPPEHLERRTGIFGPPVDVPADASLVDRVVAFSGRDPGWASPS